MSNTLKARAEAVVSEISGYLAIMYPQVKTPRGLLQSLRVEGARHIHAFALAVQQEERAACEVVALEQRCERDTGWDLACTTIAEAIRHRGTP